MWKRDEGYFKGRDGRGLLKKLVLPGFVLIGSLTASYMGVSRWMQSPQASADTVFDTSGAIRTASVNPFAHANGSNLIAYVFVASDCGWSTLPDVREAIGSLREKLTSTHGSSYAHISVIGVALDQDIEAGVQFLSEFKSDRTNWAFDQVAIGGSWLNEQVVRLAWREGIADTASPQVVVVERLVETEEYPLTSSIQLESDRLLAKRVGSDELLRWIADGLPLEESPPEDSVG